MTKDEALRLALEYVELVPDDRYNAEHIDQDALITAIKAALEAKDEPVGWNGGVPAMLPKQKEGETFIVSYEPKLEAKDERVVNTDHVICPNCVHQFRAIPQNVQKLMLASGFEPPFTTPPQRTWVGLTYDEIDELSRTMVVGERSVNWLCYAIETKLKQKNFKE